MRRATKNITELSKEFEQNTAPKNDQQIYEFSRSMEREVLVLAEAAKQLEKNYPGDLKSRYKNIN